MGGIPALIKPPISPNRNAQGWDRSDVFPLAQISAGSRFCRGDAARRCQARCTAGLTFPSGIWRMINAAQCGAVPEPVVMRGTGVQSPTCRTDSPRCLHLAALVPNLQRSIPVHRDMAAVPVSPTDPIGAHVWVQVMHSTQRCHPPLYPAPLAPGAALHACNATQSHGDAAGGNQAVLHWSQRSAAAFAQLRVQMIKALFSVVNAKLEAYYG